MFLSGKFIFYPHLYSVFRVMENFSFKKFPGTRDALCLSFWELRTVTSTAFGLPACRDGTPGTRGHVEPVV